jgi:hypothetical protein
MFANVAFHPFGYWPIHRSPTFPFGACQPKHCSQSIIRPVTLCQCIVYHVSAPQPLSAAVQLRLYPPPRHCQPIHRSPTFPSGACRRKHCSRYTIRPVNIGPCIVYHLSATQPPPAPAWLTMYSSPGRCRLIHRSRNLQSGACQPKRSLSLIRHPAAVGCSLANNVSITQAMTADPIVYLICRPAPVSRSTVQDIPTVR